jgi:hypothetical protein
MIDGGLQLSLFRKWTENPRSIKIGELYAARVVSSAKLTILGASNFDDVSNSTSSKQLISDQPQSSRVLCELSSTQHRAVLDAQDAVVRYAATGKPHGKMHGQLNMLLFGTRMPEGIPRN